MNKARQELIDEVTKALTDQGRLIEAGFAAYRLLVLHGAPQDQIDENRMAFFSGAQYLFNSMGSVVEEGFEVDAEPTENDMRRVELIQHELQVFAASMETREGREQ